MILLLIGIFFLSLGCGSDEQEQQPQLAGQESGQIVARVGNEVITAEDLEHTIKAIPTPYRYEYITASTVRDLLESMISTMLMAQEAEKIGLDKEDKIQKRLKNVASEKEREKVLAEAYLQKRLEALESVHETAIQDYYRTHQDEFTILDRVKIKRIFFENKDEAEQVQGKLQKEMTFEELMARNPQYKRKINTLWLQRRGSASEMEQIAFTLSLGEVSSPFKTTAGYCLLRVEEKVPAEVRAFAEVKEGIREKLRSKQRRALLNQIKLELREDTPTTIDETVLTTYHWKEDSS
jgi:parvulin-like peptidyl-prolyl isomerase